MTVRIIHNEEGYTLQVDHPLGAFFPARKWESVAREDYRLYWMFWGKVTFEEALSRAEALEVVEA